MEMILNVANLAYCKTVFPTPCGSLSRQASIVSHLAGRAIYIISHASIQEMHYEQVMLMAHGVDTFYIRQANTLFSRSDCSTHVYTSTLVNRQILCEPAHLWECERSLHDTVRPHRADVS